MSRVVALIGPTAAGKTDVSLDIAKELNAEIISVDSRQVYRYMDIGTDKVSPEVRREIPHYLIDVVNPDGPFSVSDFTDGAAAAAQDILSRGKVPLFVGGTPFYYNALFHASMNAALPHDPKIRRRYEDLAASEGPALLHARLAEKDPVTAGRLHPNDVRRVSRALEIFELTGTPPSRLYMEGRKLDFGFEVLYLGLTRPRQELFLRINRRLAGEFASGFPEEVAQLIERGFDERYPSMQGLGYRELAAWYRGGMKKEELPGALETAAARTRAFCRRQMTWFNKFEPAIWYDISSLSGECLRRKLLEAASRHLDGTAEIAS